MADPPPTNEPPTKTSRKFFIPLECNPEVMTSLLHTLGLSSTLAIHDVYSINDPDLLSFVPRPAYALLLVFPTNDTYEAFRVAEDSTIEAYTGSGPDEPVMWFRQTIGNACGLMALLHAAANGGAKDFIDPSSTLGTLFAAATPLPPTERAALLYNSAALEAAHQASAQQGDSVAPPATDDIDLHYVAFVAAGGRLWELDGSRTGPLDRGPIDGDALCEEALEKGPRAFMEREKAGGEPTERHCWHQPPAHTRRSRDFYGLPVLELGKCAADSAIGSDSAACIGFVPPHIHTHTQTHTSDLPAKKYVLRMAK
ncbi:hypothetical protein O988_05556 [Pseudogymnoascus sp. VKM F-3808]|nr:hypothetical protein O988_05556 [Pseudogymnoascus sp. VKM F-3808]